MADALTCLSALGAELQSLMLPQGQRGGTALTERGTAPSAMHIESQQFSVALHCVAIGARAKHVPGQYYPFAAEALQNVEHDVHWCHPFRWCMQPRREVTGAHCASVLWDAPSAEPLQ